MPKTLIKPVRWTPRQWRAVRVRARELEMTASAYLRGLVNEDLGLGLSADHTSVREPHKAAAKK
jgi:hypothetical protein